MSIDWEDFGIYNAEERTLLPSDWVHVCTVGGGGGYDWTTLHAFWSPSDRLYFWYGSTGCSCSAWGDDVYSASDFENGDRAALHRALREFAAEHSYGIVAVELFDAAESLRSFKEGGR